MKSLKLISLLLAVLICLPVLASCASSGAGEDTRPPSSGVGITGNFISADYKGEDFTFLFLQQLAGNKDYYGGNYLDAETLTGLTVEDAVYKRNLATEEKYNVKITQRIESAQAEEPASILSKFAMAGDYSYDVIYGWGYKMGACIVENLLGDMSTLPNVDLTKEYWSPSALNELTVNNKLYITINDISMNKLEWGSLLFFNKQIVEDYGLEEKIGNFYDLVNSGKWTLDNYLAAVTSVSTDVDGSGTVDITDVYGVNTGDRSGLDVAFACGVELVTKNDDGTYTLAYYSDANYDLAKKINDVYKDSKYVKDYVDLGVDANVPDGMEIHQYYRSFFASSHSLFCTGTANITGEFRNMEDEYGVIPLPKRDENQANYISTIDSNASLFAIPSTYRQDVSTASPDRTGAILEFMAAASNQLVLPAYYETMLKGQRLNSEQDKAMLDLIRNNIHYIFCDMMGVDNLREIGNNCKEMFKAPNSASSVYRSKSVTMQKALTDFYADVLKLDTQVAK
ncbi:MAG: extracellular solute-binding protein [Clostridia bacterium]|nr:extracellular solute-binding protein [Clostridia bacterium]